MPRRDESLYNRVDDVAMGREKLATGRGNFDSDPVVRRNERAPGAGGVGLMGDRQDQLVDHLPNNDGIGAVLVDRGGILRPVNQRRSRRGHWLRERNAAAPDTNDEKSD